MDLKVGVIGNGFIGREHIKRINNKLSGARVTAVNDINVEASKKIAEKFGADFYHSAVDLIQSDEVEAVIVASWDPTHAEFVLESIKAGKYVFCEKPLAASAAETLEIIDAEIESGKKLVQVGFMRRYDPGYREIKNEIENKEIGSPLIIHSIHRNRVPEPQFTTEMSIKNSVIHEIDLYRWLLGEDYKLAQVIIPKTSKHAAGKLLDPQIVLLETESGIRIDIESFVSCQYGYDVRCEVVGEEGTVTLADPRQTIKRKSGQKSQHIFPDWSDRFTEAYDIELQEWINDVKNGEMNGPSSWDGYMASYTADLCSQARINNKIVEISAQKCPDFYTE